MEKWREQARGVTERKDALKKPKHCQFLLGTFFLNKSCTINEREMFSVSRSVTPESPLGKDMPILSGFPNLLHLIDWVTAWEETK